MLRTALLVAIMAPAFLFFNLEPRIAIVKTGPPGSYFGYSVAQHQIVDRNSLDSIALVGAPKDNSSQPGTERSVQSIQAGVTWSPGVGWVARGCCVG